MIDETSQFFAILTNVGAAKQANADALGVPWKLTEMGVGDANGTDPIPNASQTTLINEWRRRPLNQLFINPSDPSVIVAEQVIPADEGGHWIREIGLYDADGDLVAVASCAPSYKPVMSQGSGRTQVVRMNFVVRSTGNITLKIDPSVVLATREFVERRILEELYKLDSKQSVRVATTANIALSGLLVVDGVTLLAGDRVLVKNQTTAKDNGIYIVGAAAWQRAPDADSSAEVTSALIVSVEQGASLADTRWQLVTDGAIVLGTTALTFQNITQGFAPISSPALTGVPTAPTAAQSVSNTQIATTAFVKAAVNAVGLGDASLLAAIPDMDDVTFPSGFYYASGSSTLNLPIQANGTVIHRIYGAGGLQIFQTYANNNLLWRRRTPTQWEPWNSIAALDSPVFTGNPTAPTQAQFDNSKRLATTEYVMRTAGNYRGFTSLTTATTLTASAVGTLVTTIGTFTLTLPAANALPSGGAIHFRNIGSGVITVACAGSDLINAGGSNQPSSIALQPGATLELTSNGASAWWAEGTAQLQYSKVFGDTPAQFDNSKLLATAEFVRRQGKQYSGFTSYNGNGTLPAASAGQMIMLFGSAASTINLPSAVGLPVGATFTFINYNTVSATINRASTDVIYGVDPGQSVSVTSMSLLYGDILELTLLSNTAGTGAWYVSGGNMVVSSVVPQFDSSNRPASTKFVKQSGVEWSGFATVSASTVLGNGSVGGIVSASSSTAINVTLPPTAPLWPGAMIMVIGGGTGAASLLASNGELISNSNGGAITPVLGQGDSAILVRLPGAGEWRLVGGSVSLRYSASFSGVVGSSGRQRLPNGMLMQWLSVAMPTTQGSSTSFNWPIAFDNAISAISFAPDFTVSGYGYVNLAVVNRGKTGAQLLNNGMSVTLGSVVPTTVIGIGY